MNDRQNDRQNTGSKPPQPKPTDKAHAIALALLRAGFAVSHGTLNGMQFPRIIRPLQVQERR